VPQYFKDYVIDEVVIVLLQVIRPNPNEEVEDGSNVYDGPTRTRELNLANEGESYIMVFIGDHLTEEESEKLRQLLKGYRDCFAWNYQDLKGISEEVVVHTIPLRVDAKPISQRPYRTNPKVALTIQEKLKKLLGVGFIYKIEHFDWASLIVCVPKKNEKLRVCVYFKKLNAHTIKDHYPLPYIGSILERLAGHEAYSFLDGFSSYNQFKITVANQHKTAFATE